MTNDQWGRLKPWLPPQKPHTGRPAEDHRRIINGILWILRTGAPWRYLPKRYGPWQTVACRFYRWRKAGIWDALFAVIQAEADLLAQIDWDIHFVDGTVVHAHQHARRCKRGDLVAEALGWSRGRFSTKVHLRAEGNGNLMTLVLTPGQRHESTVFVPLMQGGAVRRVGRGRPKQQPKRTSGDKGYSYKHIREYLRRHGIRCTIPRRKDQHRGGPFDRTLYKLRNRVERLINKLKHFRRLATRYEKRAANFRAMWVIDATILWLRFANTI